MLWWDESLATGIATIDEQHKSIFSKTNEILSLNITTPLEEIKKDFDFLVDYSMSHFYEEEKAMLKFNYRGFIKHRMQHSYFMTEIFNLKLELEKGLTEELLDKLKLLVVEWLAKHINEDDKAFVDTIK